MKTIILIAAGLFLLVALTPSSPAISVHLPAPDPARGLLGVSFAFHLHLTPKGGTADTVYFVKAEKAASGFGADDLIVSNFEKSGNVYLLNAEPGRYVAIGAEIIDPGTMHRSVVVFSQSDIPRTEIEVRAKSVALMGVIQTEGSWKQRELDSVQTNSLTLILARSTRFPGVERALNPDFAHPAVIKSIERGEAADSGFWYSARTNHFRNEAAWQSLINARPVLPPEGVATPKRATE